MKTSQQPISTVSNQTGLSTQVRQQRLDLNALFFRATCALPKSVFVQMKLPFQELCLSLMCTRITSQMWGQLSKIIVKKWDTCSHDSFGACQVQGSCGPINLNIHNTDINIGIGIVLILVWLTSCPGFIKEETYLCKRCSFQVLHRILGSSFSALLCCRAVM